MIHTNVKITNQPDGSYVIDYTDGRPLPGDQVLMSVELFELAIEALNRTEAFPLAEPVPGHDATVLKGNR